MRVKAKKTFELSSIKKYKRYQRKLWLIPTGCLPLSMIGLGEKTLNILRENPSIVTVIGILLTLLFYTLVISIIPFFVGKITIGIGLKTTIRNCTISSMQDFDYYRDKLTGLSPATISILTDLEIEQKKDVAAAILQYENLGLLVEGSDHTYHTTDQYDNCTELNDSDRYLIEHLKKGNFDWDTDTRWRQLVIDEAVSDGYIAKVSTPCPKPQRVNDPQRKKDHLMQKKPVSLKWRVIQILLGILWFCWLLGANPRMEAYQQYIDMFVRRTGSEEEIINALYQPEMLFVGIEEIALFLFAVFLLSYRPGKKSKMHPDSKKGFVVIVIWICLMAFSMPRLAFFWMRLESYVETADIGEQTISLFNHPQLLFACAESLVCFIYTMFLISYMFAGSRIFAIVKKNTKSIKRTDYGNYMAECVYGMKNFIHDFSNLNEADKCQVVLWEDYLVYAVVLEENEEIVNEILKTVKVRKRSLT